MKYKMAISLLGIAGVLTAIAFIWRLFSAQMMGNIWLAFQQDSFMGYPMTHIVSGFACVFLFAGLFKLESSLTQHKTKEV